MTTEGFLQTVIRKCIAKASSSKVAKECLDDCITTLVFLKEEYELQGKGNFGLYSLIKTQFENTINELTENNLKNKELTQRINKQISTFLKEAEFNRIEG